MRIVRWLYKWFRLGPKRPDTGDRLWHTFFFGTPIGFRIPIPVSFLKRSFAGLWLFEKYFEWTDATRIYTVERSK